VMPLMQFGLPSNAAGPDRLGRARQKGHEEMSVQTSPYASDALPGETVDAVVLGGGAAGLNGALMLARSRRSVVVIDSGTPRNAPAEAMHGFIVLDGTPPREILRRGPGHVRQDGGRLLF